MKCANCAFQGRNKQNISMIAFKQNAPFDTMPTARIYEFNHFDRWPLFRLVCQFNVQFDF